jgi:hypothetical protein
MLRAPANAAARMSRAGYELGEDYSAAGLTTFLRGFGVA